MVWHKADGKKTCISWPKWLMEQHLGRLLTDEETVDHVDRDFTNDDLSNLRVIPRGQHVKEDARRVKPITIVCVWCGKSAEKSGRDLDGNARKGKAGPFCGRSCAGQYGKYVQGGGKPLDRTPAPTRIYYYLDK